MKQPRLALAMLIVLLPAAVACTPFGTAPTGCSITQVGASAANGGSGHHYDFVLANVDPALGFFAPCPGADAHVLANYDVNTKQASEKGDYQGAKLSALWSCSSDPWIFAADQQPQCIRISSDLSGDTSHVDIQSYDNATFPLSANFLIDIARQTLNGQLQNAIKQLQANTQPNPQANTQPTRPVVDTSSAAAAQRERADCPNGTHDPQLVDGWPNLDACSQGRLLLVMHYLLADHGVSEFESIAQQYFTPKLADVVRQWEQANGLPATGTVGAAAWPALIVTVQQPSPDHVNAVKAAQTILKARGEDVVVDGDFGPQTDAAVRDYQTQHNLFVDGQVGPQTWQSLLGGP